MNTTSALPPYMAHTATEDAAQPFIYSFRCSRGMEACLSRFMNEQGLNRSSVIRLALYALDCFSRRRDVRGRSLHELLVMLERMAPGASLSFAEFIRGK